MNFNGCGVVFASMSKQKSKNFIRCFQDRYHIFQQKNGKSAVSNFKSDMSNFKKGIFSTIYKNINQKQLSWLVICYKLLMHFPFDRKVKKKKKKNKFWYEKTFNCGEISRIKEGEVRDTFQ